WPMPREAPVKISVLRSALGVLDIVELSTYPPRFASGLPPALVRGRPPSPPLLDYKRGGSGRPASQRGAGQAPLLAKRAAGPAPHPAGRRASQTLPFCSQEEGGSGVSPERVRAVARSRSEVDTC